jgi:hypothetical protein
MSERIRTWRESTLYHQNFRGWLYLCFRIVTLGICITYKTGFGFDDQIYWTFIELGTNYYLTHCHLLRLDTLNF